MNEKETQNIIFNTLHSDAYLSVNRKLIREIGLNSAVLLSDLISKHKYFKDRNTDEDDWFFNTETNRKNDTGLTKSQQRKCVLELKENELIYAKRKGLPAKIYFKINYIKVIEIIKNSVRGLEVKKTWTRSEKNVDYINKNKVNNNKIKKNKKPPLYPPAGGDTISSEKLYKNSDSEMEDNLPLKNKNNLFSDSLKLLPEKLRNQEFISIWRLWFKFRAEIKKKLTPVSINRQINLLDKYSSIEAIKIIDRSIVNGWTGLFPDKAKNTSTPEEKYSNRMKRCKTIEV